MKVTLQSTDKIITLVVDGRHVAARVWEGTTEAGIPCHAYITRIAVARDQDAAEFERDLQEHVLPSSGIAALPLHLII